MLTLGIDPGTALMGYGLVASESGRLEYVDCGVLTTPSTWPFPQRLQSLYRDLLDLIDRYRPTDLAIEEVFFAKNARSAFAVGHARGVAILAGANRGLQIGEYTPMQIKQAVSGYGRGDKAQIQTMVRLILNLDSVPQPDDAADAVAAAICHSQMATMAALLQGSR